MSLAAIGQRVAQIDQLVGLANGTSAAPSSTGFTQALQSASATSVSAAPTTASTAGDSTAYDADIATSAAKYGISPALLKGLIRQESGFNATATSGAGAQGLTQLMPATAASLGVDASDPAQAIDGGAHYLREQLDHFGGDVAKALAAYNAGPGAVEQYGGVPPYAETQDYVASVQAFAQQYGVAAPPATSAVTAAALPVATAPVLATTSGSSLGYSTV